MNDHHNQAAPQVLHTVAIYLAGDSGQRVQVDMLAGTPDQAMSDAQHILRTVAANPSRWITRVVSSEPVTDA